MHEKELLIVKTLWTFFSFQCQFGHGLNGAFLHSFAQFCAQIFQKFDKKMIKSLVQLSLETHFPMIELTGFGFYPTPSLSNSSSRFSFKFINLLHLWTLGCTKINEIHSPLCDFQNQIVSGFFSLNFL